MRNNNFSKEHIRLYKSKKKWVAVTIFTTSLGIGGASLVENVYANSVSGESLSTNQTTISKSSQMESSSVLLIRSCCVLRKEIALVVR